MAQDSTCGMLEKEIQKQIIDYLNARGIFCWKHRNGGSFGKKKSYQTVLGIPDIIGFLDDGTFLGIEVKTSTGILSDEQKDFSIIAKRTGARVFTARCLQDVIDELYL